MKPPRALGGKRKGAGRPPDWLKKKCADAVDRRKLIDFLVGVATGKETEPHVIKCNGDTSIEECAPSIHDRLRAVEMLLDRGFGKPTETHNVNVSGDLAVEIVEGFKRIAND